MDCNLLGSSVHGILQARILEWVPFPSLGDLPNSGIEPGTHALQADSLQTEPSGKPEQVYNTYIYHHGGFVSIMKDENRVHSSLENNVLGNSHQNSRGLTETS